MNWPALLNAILDQYALHPDGIHGAAHWARVLENGRRLSALTGASLPVVEFFAVFHDACRVSDGWDFAHGARGAALAKRLRGKYFDLPDDQFKLLADACRGHTGGRGPGDITILTCWDSDRLDLLRVGITPNPRFLLTEAARDPALRAWANERAESGFLPALIQSEWALDGRFQPD